MSTRDRLPRLRRRTAYLEPHLAKWVTREASRGLSESSYLVAVAKMHREAQARRAQNSRDAEAAAPASSLKPTDLGSVRWATWASSALAAPPVPAGLACPARGSHCLRLSERSIEHVIPRANAQGA